ncbi:MAG: hypothetical protein JJU45_16170 [Acidimicrobiia bacterium]|nr:hypothetical protein [Acidimicrobiia bacterium]
MSDGPEEEAGSGGYLAPLPKRVLDDDGGGSIDTPLDVFVRELLERANVLLSTLDADVDSLRRDQEKAIARIEREWEQRKADAAVATELLEAMLARAQELAQRKGRSDVLARALKTPVDPRSLRRLSVVVDDIEEELKLAKGITGAIRLETIGKLLREASMGVQVMQRRADTSRQELLAETERDLDAEVVEASASFEIGSSILTRDLDLLADHVPVSAAPFDDPRWEEWTPPSELSPWVRLGGYWREGMEAHIPCLLANPPQQGLSIEPGGFRNDVVGGVRSLLLRLFAGAPPGALRCTIIDPVGLGDVAGPLLDLLEFEPHLLEGGVATSEEDIGAALRRVNSDVERVVQHYLRGRYDTLAEANAAAGELLEPHRALVVMDYPTGFDEHTQALLRRLVEQAHRVGLFPVIVRDPAFRPVFGGPRVDQFDGLEVISADAKGLWRDEGVAGRWQVHFDEPPAPAGSDGPAAGLIERVVAAVGQAAQSTTGAGVEPDVVWRLLAEARALRARADLPVTTADVVHTDPTTWWHADAEPSLSVPIGRAGVADVVTLQLGGGDRAGALVVGGDGSGVTTLLHSVVGSMAQLYPPDGVDLYLVALGARATFAPAATAGLPHARLVADTAPASIGIDLLERFAARVEAHHAGRPATNDAAEPDAPRIVLVIDGIEDLYDTDDVDARRVTALVEQLLHDGGDAGVHLICTVRCGDVARATATLQRLPLAAFSSRLVLDSPPEVLARFVGDDRADEHRPSRPGDALLTAGPLADPRLRPVRLTHLDDRARYRLLRILRETATARGVTNRPQIFDGAAPARLELSPLQRLLFNTDQRGARLQARLWVGEPASLGDPVEVLLRRQDGANVLVMTDDMNLGCGVLVAALTSGVLVHGNNLEVRALDFTPLDSGFAEAVGAFSQHWPVEVERRRNAAKTLDGVHRAIQDRLADSDYRRAPLLLLIGGIDRARDIDVTATDNDGPDLHRLVRSILADGPEVGVHTLAWAGSLPAFERRLGSGLLREFAVRILGSVPEEVSMSMADTPAAASLDAHQGLLYDEDWGRVLRFRPFILPPVTWLSGLAQAAAGINPATS